MVTIFSAASSGISSFVSGVLKVSSKRHYQFDQVQGVGAKVFHKACGGHDVFFFDAQLFHDDSFYLIKDCCHVLSPF